MRTSAGEVSEVVHRQLHTRTPNQLLPQLALGNLPTWTKMPSSIPTPRAFTISLLCLAFFPPSSAQDTSQSLWDVRTSTSNNNNTSSSRIDNLVASMTPEEKIRQVHHFWTAGTQDFAAYVNGTARLGIPPDPVGRWGGVGVFFSFLPFFSPSRQGKNCAQVIM